MQKTIAFRVKLLLIRANLMFGRIIRPPCTQGGRID